MRRYLLPLLLLALVGWGGLHAWSTAAQEEEAGGWCANIPLQYFILQEDIEVIQGSNNPLIGGEIGTESGAIEIAFNFTNEWGGPIEVTLNRVLFGFRHYYEFEPPPGQDSSSIDATLTVGEYDRDVSLIWSATGGDFSLDFYPDAAATSLEFLLEAETPFFGPQISLSELQLYGDGDNPWEAYALEPCAPAPAEGTPFDPTWCYLFDFTTDDRDFVAPGDEWTAGYGFLIDDATQLNYTHYLTVAPSEVEMVFSRGPTAAGAINFSTAGTFFGVPWASYDSAMLEATDEMSVWANQTAATQYGTAFSLLASADDEVYLSKIYVRGFDVSPFGADNCNPPTPTPAPTDTPTQTDTPTVTNTPPVCAQVYRDYTIESDGAELGSRHTIEAIQVDDYVADNGRYLNGGLYNRYAGFRVPATDFTTVHNVDIEYAYKRYPAQPVGLYTGRFNADLTGIATLVNVGPVGTQGGTWNHYSAATNTTFDATDWIWVTVGISGNGSNDVDASSYVRVRTLRLLITPRDCSTATPAPTYTPLPSNTPRFTVTPRPTATITPTPTYIIVPTYIYATPQPTRNPAYYASATQFMNTAAPILTATAAPAMSATAASWTQTPTINPSASPSATIGAFTQPDVGNSPLNNDLRDSVMGMVNNVWQAATGWTSSMAQKVGGLSEAWRTAAPVALPFMPDCAADTELENQLCAIWYILTFTVFAGPVGGLIIPAALVVVDLYWFLRFLKMVRAILAQTKEIRR